MQNEKWARRPTSVYANHLTPSPSPAFQQSSSTQRVFTSYHKARAGYPKCIKVNPLKLRPPPQIDSAGGEVVGDGVLLVEDGFDPGAGGFVLHVHQVEDFQADP